MFPRSVFPLALRLLVSLGLLTSILVLATTPATAAPGDATTLNGTIFRDYNFDGIPDAGEPGEDGITVTGYCELDDDGAGVTPGIDPLTPTATTAADGTYSLAVKEGYDCRVEVTGWPTYLQPGPNGAGNGTTVQFVRPVPAGGATGVDTSLINPADYCDSDPKIATTCFVFGTFDGPNTTEDSIAGTNWQAGASSGLVGTDYGAGTATHNSTFAETGTTFGAAWQRSTDALFTGAFMKHYSGFGPSGPGAIYSTGVSSATGATTTPSALWLDIYSLPGVTPCVDPHGDDLTPPGSPGTPPAGTAGWPAMVTEAYAAVGNCSLLDIEVSDDETTLYVTNLANTPTSAGQILAIDIASKALVGGSPWEIPTDQADCPDPVEDIHPGALAYDDEVLFVGLTCGAESTGDAADLRMYVYEVDPASGAFVQVMNEPLTYVHGPGSFAWNAWSNDPTDVVYYNNPASQVARYPQPWLSDLGIVGGEMTLGIRDRGGDQGPWYAPDLAGGVDRYIAAGELLCASQVGGTWTLESGGVCPTGRTGAGTWDNGGPGGAEFFEDGSDGHSENSFGGVSMIPGFSEVGHTAQNPQDPFSDWNDDPQGTYSAAGFMYNSLADGTLNRGFLFFDRFSGGGGGPIAGNPFFGKANGLGDVEALCQLAPIEIGNYVWYDADGDGVQDPSELPVVGATVNLYAADRTTLLGTAITGPDGEYYFDVDPDTEYVVRMDNAADYDVGGPLENWSLTIDSGDADDDADSDGLEGADGFPEIVYTTGGPGENDHTLDFGFTAPFDLALQKQLADGTNLGTFAPGDGVTFTMTLENQGATDATNVEVVDYLPTGLTLDDAAWTDNGDGTASLNTPIPSMLVGDIVEVDITFTIDADAAGQIDNWAEIADALDGDGNPTTDIDSIPDTTQGNDNQPSGPEDVTDDETGEDGRNGGDEDDHDVAGIVVVPEDTYSLGNQVWFDDNNNGMIDPGEAPIEGVWVELFTDTDGDGLPDDLNGDGVIDVNDAIATTGTDADGNYLFDGLEPGEYIVGIPPMEWEEGGPLEGYMSSDPTSTDPNDDVDNDDNGTPGPFGYVWSGPVTIGDGEPTGEVNDNDPNTPDENENLTVDFGFHKPIFDIALFKTLADGTNLATVAIGDDVTFTMSVVNQGDIDAKDIFIVDYIPTGLTLNDPDWINNGDGTASYALAGITLAPGETVTVDVTFTVNADATGTIDNWGEVTEATPVDETGTEITYPDGSELADIDSIPDADNSDVFDTDDDVTGDGLAGGDEDDHDRAQLTISSVAVPDDDEEVTLPATGRNSDSIALLGLILLGGGLLLLGGSARRASRRI